MILGIDIGGTTVKFGVVSADGEIIEKKAHDTHSWDSSAEIFIENLASIIQTYQSAYEIQGVGIGIPGLLSADRKSTLDLANIPALNNQPVVDMLHAKLGKETLIRIENDAKCAALGEIYFGAYDDLTNYLMIALGTGVGGGLVLDSNLFTGVNGNATEIGHIPLSDGIALENHVGQQKITAFTKGWLKDPKYADSSLQGKDISPKTIFEEAKNGDRCAQEVFFYVGECVGEVLVGIMRLLDISTFLLAGGVSGASEFIKPGIDHKLKAHLPTYYTDKTDIRRASLNADSGLLGAASLIMHQRKKMSA